MARMTISQLDTRITALEANVESIDSQIGTIINILEAITARIVEPATPKATIKRDLPEVSTVSTDTVKPENKPAETFKVVHGKVNGYGKYAGQVFEAYYLKEKYNKTEWAKIVAKMKSMGFKYDKHLTAQNDGLGIFVKTA